MTTQKFSPGIERVLDHMRETEGWNVQMWGDCPKIRRDVEGGPACPISSMDGETGSQVRSVAERLGIDDYELIQIVDSADCHGQCFDSALRAAMLEVGRIEEVAGA